LQEQDGEIMLKYRLKKKNAKKEFKVTCKYCGHKDEASKFHWHCYEQEDAFCFSGGKGVQLRCPKCNLEVWVYEE